MNIVGEENSGVRQQVKERLLKKIRSAEINTRLPSERALAEEFSICRATVNKVMEELELEGYIRRRVGKGTFVVPRDNTVLKSIESGRMLGDVIIAYPDFFSYWIWENVHIAEVKAMQNNLNLINLKLQPESDFTTLVDLIRSRDKLLGVMLVPPSSSIPKGILQTLDRLPVPTVILGPLEQARIFRRIYEVRNDHYKSGYLKMECLLRYGHRRIGFVPNEPQTLAGSEHVRGVKQALYDHGLRWKDLTPPDTAARPWEDSTHIGYVQAREVLDRRPDLTAILCDTIAGAFGVLRALYELKRRCPEDISLITAHSNFNIENYSCPKLTSVNASAEETIAAAMNIILHPDRVHSRSILVDMTLQERESVININGGK